MKQRYIQCTVGRQMCEAYKRRDEPHNLRCHEKTDVKIVADDVGTLRKQNVKVGEKIK